MPVVLAQEVESVLIGAAILGACASEDFASLQVCNHGRTGYERLISAFFCLTSNCKLRFVSKLDSFKSHLCLISWWS